MSNVELATGYVAIVPSAKGIEASIAKELAPVAAAAESTGTQAGSKLSGGILSQLGGISPKLVAGLGFAAIGVAAYQAAVDVDTAYDTIRVGTGQTGKALESLEASFRDVASAVPASFGDVANVVADLNTRLEITGPRLEELATQVLNLSRLTKTDAKQNVADLTRLFGDWSIATEEQSETLDKLFRATQATGIGLSDLAQSVVQYGAPLRNLGFTFDQALAIFSKFEKEGVNIETVLAGLRFGLKSFAAAGEEPIEALERVIDRIKNAGSAAEANSIAFETFGVRAGPDMAAAIREGRFELDSLIERIANGSDTITQAAEDTDDVRESMQLLGNQAKLLLADIGAPLFAGLTDGARAAFPALQLLGDGLRLIEPAIGPAVLGVAAFYAAAKVGQPLVAGLGSGVQALGQALLNSGFDPNGPAIQGLASFANGVDRFGAKLPLIAATTAAAAVSFNGIGESTTKSAVGIGSLVAAGASIGSVFGPAGTVIGATTGLLAGMGKELLSGGMSAEEMRRAVAGLATELESLGSRKAAEEFFAGVAAQTAFAGDQFKVAKQHLNALAEASPAAAQRVLDGLRSMRDEAGKPLFSGKELDAFAAAIDRGGEALLRTNTRKTDAQRVNQQYASSEAAAAGAVGATTGAIDTQTDALEAQLSALLSTYDAQFAAEHATDQAAGALLNYAAAAGNSTTTQEQLNDVLVTAEETSLRAASAVGAKAAADNAGAGAAASHNANIEAQIGYLTNLASTLSPDDPLRVFLDQYIAKLAGMPRAVETTVDANTGPAESKIDRLQAKLAAISRTFIAAGGSGQGEVYVPESGYSFDLGGMVPGPVGAAVQATVHAGEAVLTPQQQASVIRALENASRGINIGLAIPPAGYVAPPVGVRSSALWTQEMVDAWEATSGASTDSADALDGLADRVKFITGALDDAHAQLWYAGLIGVEQTELQARSDQAAADLAVAQKALDDAKAKVSADLPKPSSGIVDGSRFADAVASRDLLAAVQANGVIDEQIAAALAPPIQVSVKDMPKPEPSIGQIIVNLTVDPKMDTAAVSRAAEDGVAAALTKAHVMLIGAT